MAIAHGCRLIVAAMAHNVLAVATTTLNRVFRTVQRARVKRLGQPSSSVAVRITMSCQRSPTNLTSQSAQALSKSPYHPICLASSTSIFSSFSRPSAWSLCQYKSDSMAEMRFTDDGAASESVSNAGRRFLLRK